MTEASTNPNPEVGQTASTLPEFIGKERWQVYDSTTYAKNSSFFYENQISATSYKSYDNAFLPDLPSEAEEAVMKIVRGDFDETVDNSDSFDYELFNIINTYDSISIMIISNLIYSGKIEFMLAIKILGFLGRINHPQTYHHRTLLLEKCLSHESKYIREGARLGLLYLMNPSAIPSLKKAIEKENAPQLKNKMIYVLEMLGKIN
jgi:hypothetical protein